MAWIEDLLGCCCRRGNDTYTFFVSHRPKSTASGQRNPEGVWKQEAVRFNEWRGCGAHQTALLVSSSERPIMNNERGCGGDLTKEVPASTFPSEGCGGNRSREGRPCTSFDYNRTKRSFRSGCAYVLFAEPAHKEHVTP